MLENINMPKIKEKCNLISFSSRRGEASHSVRGACSPAHLAAIRRLPLCRYCVRPRIDKRYHNKFCVHFTPLLARYSRIPAAYGIVGGRNSVLISSRGRGMASEFRFFA